MTNIDELLSLSEGNKNDKKEACKGFANLDEQYDVVMDRLRELSTDKDKGVKKEANKALKALANKPIAKSSADEEGGTSGTAFDDEVGDSSLEAGEYDVESSMSKAEEDRIEAAADGKGLNVLLLEKNFARLDYYGKVQEREAAVGEVIVTNTGNKSRITGVDLELANVDKVKSDGLEEKIHIGLIAPGTDNAWKKEYAYETEFEPITVVQTYADPETGVSPNFLGGVEKSFELKITIQNTMSVPIYNVKGTKTLNEIANIGEMHLDNGEISKTEGGLEFNIEEIDAGETVEVVINLSATLPEGVEAYESGNLDVVYNVKDELVSGLEFTNIDGVSNMKQKVRRKQREEEPTLFDCEIKFTNRSEFVYDLNRFTVFADDMESNQLVLDWDGEQATEDEREIVPTEDVVFEFVYESPDSTPQFGNFIDFSVQHEMSKLTENLLTLPLQKLKFMAIEISKLYMKDGEEITELELESYRETPIDNVVTVKGVGTFPVEAVIINEQIPPGFDAPEQESIVIKRNGNELPKDAYSYELMTDSEVEGGQRMILSLENLQETEDGGFNQDELLTIEYTAVAINPEPREDPIRAVSYAEAFLYEAPEAKVRAETEIEGLALVVVHRRAELDISKDTAGVDYEGQNAYEIEIEAENNGTSTESIVVSDLIPSGFRLVEETLTMTPEGVTQDVKSTDDGNVHGWKFENIEPGNTLIINFTVVQEDENANTRRLFTVYKG